MRRQSVHKHSSARSFRRSASRIKGLNMINPMRGGIRI